jgi:hypothetical protein
VQTFYPHDRAANEWLLAALRVLAQEARDRGLLGAPAIEAGR